MGARSNGNGGSRGRDLKEKSLYFQKNALCLA